jgi:hypothetical protein
MQKIWYKIEENIETSHLRSQSNPSMLRVRIVLQLIVKIITTQPPNYNPDH